MRIKPLEPVPRFVAGADAVLQIGLVIRTRDGVRTVFVSVGHWINPESAGRAAMESLGLFQIPESTRHADIEVRRLKA